VEHISDTKRLQQECNVVSIRIAKTSGDNVNLSEFKSCMLAALRSLLPTTWDTNHELAWNWLLGTVVTVVRVPFLKHEAFCHVGNPSRM
jgi:hypothetical protein